MGNDNGEWERSGIHEPEIETDCVAAGTQSAGNGVLVIATFVVIPAKAGIHTALAASYA
jgi:hypothetical protein